MFSSNQAIEFWNKEAEKFLTISRPPNSFYNKRMDIIEKLVCRYSSPSTALDIGSAEGDLVVRLFQLGYDSYGTDISHQMIEAAIKKTSQILPEAASRFRLTQGNTEPFITEFDLVTAIGVLPYIANHYDYFEYLDTMLNKNGILIITCCSPFSIYNVLQIIKHLWKFKFKLHWVTQLKNMFKTGLRSGGFIDHTHTRQVHSVRGLKKLTRTLDYDLLETISFYNINLFDTDPINRSKLGRILSQLFGWTHMAIAQK